MCRTTVCELGERVGVSALPHVGGLSTWHVHAQVRGRCADTEGPP